MVKKKSVKNGGEAYKQRPVDIILGTQSRFEARKEVPSVENEVYRKGVLLYDAGSQRVV